MALSLVTAVLAEPVSLAEVKAWCRVDSDMHADDALLTSLITAARQSIDGPDGWLGRALMKQTWDLKLDRFPAGWSHVAQAYDTIVVPLPPLISVTSLTYVDTAGTSTTLATTEYTVDTASEPARITPAYSKSWPSTRDVMHAVTVRIVCGYATANAVPTPIKTGLKSLVAHLYAEREAVSDGAKVVVPWHVEQLLANYRIWAVAA